VTKTKKDKERQTHECNSKRSDLSCLISTPGIFSLSPHPPEESQKKKYKEVLKKY